NWSSTVKRPSSRPKPSWKEGPSMSHAAAELSLWNILVDDPALEHAAMALRENFLMARLAEARPAGFFPTSVSSAPGAPTPRGDEATIRVSAGDGDVD